MAPLVKQSAAAMGKKRNAPTQKPTAADENNGLGGVLLPGATLEDYFHSKKLGDTGGLGQVSKHLLVGTPTNNAMTMEREEGEDDTVDSKATPESSALAESKDEDEDAKVIDDEDEAKPGSKACGQEADDGRHSNHDEYEDDYESDSPSPDQKNAAGVAGMTLSDYLQAKETDGDEEKSIAATDNAKHVPIVNKRHEAAAPKTKAVVVQQAAAKKAVPPTLISGMSLDHYLGASSAMADDDGHTGDSNDSDTESNSKSPTAKRKKSKPRLGSKSLGTITKTTTTTGAAQEEHATPFQKRLSKKLKAKAKQQPGNSNSNSNGVSIAKPILLADAPSSTMSLQTKSIGLNGASSIKDAKKKPQYQSQYGHTHSQPPLPKLVASSSFAHSLLHSKDAIDTTGVSEDDERLPPLTHY